MLAGVFSFKRLKTPIFKGEALIVFLLLMIIHVIILIFCGGFI